MQGKLFLIPHFPEKKVNIRVNLSLFIPLRTMEGNISILSSDWRDPKWRDTLEKVQLLLTQEPQELHSGTRSTC